MYVYQVKHSRVKEQPSALLVRWAHSHLLMVLSPVCPALLDPLNLLLALPPVLCVTLAPPLTVSLSLLASYVRLGPLLMRLD